MKKFFHEVISFDRLLTFDRDGECSRLLLGCQVPLEGYDSVRAMMRIRDNLDFRMAGEHAIMFMHPFDRTEYVSCRVLMHPKDVLRCRYPAGKADDCCSNVVYPAGKFYVKDNAEYDADDLDVLNSVEIARVYRDHIAYKPRFSIDRYTVDEKCAEATRNWNMGEFLGNFVIDTSYSQRTEDFSKLNGILAEGADAYGMRHGKLIEDAKRRRAECACHMLDKYTGGTSFFAAETLYNIFLKGYRDGIYGTAASRFRIGKSGRRGGKEIYVYRLNGNNYIYVPGIAGAVISPDVTARHSTPVDERSLAQFARFSEFVRFLDTVKFTNSAVRDLIFVLFVQVGCEVVTPEHIFAVPYRDTREYLTVSRLRVVLSRDKSKNYMWTIAYLGKTVRVVFNQKPSNRCFGAPREFSEDIKDALQELRAVKAETRGVYAVQD